MKRGSGGAAGRGGQGGAVVSGDDALASTTQDEDRARVDLAELETGDEQVRRAAESLERRLHDLALVQELQAENFAGAGWVRFADELARYGHAVLVAWMRNRTIAAACARKGRPIGTLPMSWTELDIGDLATDAVIDGIALFREKALVKGGWAFEGGAGLKTFFVGAAILSFPGVYRKWCRRQNEEAQLRWFGTALDMEGFFDGEDDPGEVLVLQQMIKEGLAALPGKRTGEVVGLQALGYSYDEIADLLGTSAGAVAQVLVRHRDRTNGEEST